MTNEFFEAITKGDIAGVRKLLEADPGLVNARKAGGESAILLALYSHHRELVEIILSKGPELNLFEASAAGKLDRVQVIVEADPGAVHSYSHDGWTPLHLAAYFGHQEVAGVLLARGADVRTVSRNSNKNTPLHAAMPLNQVEVARQLLAKGAEVNARQVGGYTPLHAAASEGNAEMVKLLLTSGADPNLKSDEGKTSLAFALEKGRQEVVGLLRKHGGI